MKTFSIRNLAPLVMTFALICLPLVAVGQALDNSVPGGFDNSVPGGFNNQTPSANTTSVTPKCNGGTCSIDNPLKVTNFCDLLKVVLQALLILGLPVAVIFLVLAGLRFIVARGRDAELIKAKDNLMYTIIGVAIFLGAWTIAQIIKSTLTSLGVSGFGSC